MNDVNIIPGDLGWILIGTSKDRIEVSCRRFQNSSIGYTKSSLSKIPTLVECANY
jgi:hypothetical protein